MKKKLIMMLAVVVAMAGFAENVTNVRGRQRENSNLVDIYYDIEATDGGTYSVAVQVEGRTNTVTAATFTGDVGEGVAPGRNRHIVWNAGADWLSKRGDVRITVTATKEPKKGAPGSGVQLWAGGPYWADRNVGASSPEDSGLYFWWGDTTGYRPSGTTFSFSFISSNTPTSNKSPVTLQSEGWVVPKNGTYGLAPAHDAAHVKWGGSWRMPTYQEFSSLNNKCDWTWTTRNGVKGYIVRGRNAYVANSIFLPASGYGYSSDGYETSLYNFGSRGYYWSSVPGGSGDYDDYEAYYWSCGLYFYSGYRYTSYGYREDGRSIRPVQGFTSDSSTEVSTTRTGSSAWFFVDTTDGDLKISDVTSKYFDGEYGGKTGRKSTFLNGTPCEIEMDVIMDDYSEVDHWLVNGQEVTARTFTVDVGMIEIGGKLEVVAVGKEPGVRSNPFRANVEVAEHVGNAGMWGARPSNSGGIDEIVYTPLGGSPSVSFPFASEKKGTKPESLKWLPGDEWALSPKIELKPEVRSDGNGSFTFGTIGENIGTSGSEGTASHKRNLRSVGKLARVMDKEVGISFTGGPLAMSWNAQKGKWVAEEVSFGGEVSGSLGLTHHYPTPIGPVFLEVKGELALAGTFKVSGIDSALSGADWGGLESSFVLSSDRLPKVSVAGGYGINNVANVKATISGMSVLEATHSKGAWTDVKWGLRGSGALTAKFLPFEATLFELTSETLWIINNSSAKSARLLSAASADGLDWRLQPRDYLGTAKRGVRLMAASVGDGCAVVESGDYPEAAPAMASGVKGDALAYLRDNAARSSANRTELVLRVGASNEWNAAETVWDDGTADFLPSIAAMPDGSIAAAWMNAARTFTDDVTVDEFCGAEEIAVGIRNAATGAWMCKNLTADSAFDFSPVVRAAANGKVLVAWLRNASGKLTSSAEEPTDVMAAIYSGGAWGGATIVRRGVGIVNGFDVAFDGENAMLAFSKDSDGNPDTADDAEVFAFRMSGGAWGSPVRLTAAGEADGVPLVRTDGEGGFAVLWTAKGMLMETRELAVSNAVAVAAADGWTLPARPTMIRGAGGRDALVWNGISEAGGAADAPTAMMYDPICGVWGAPVKLFDDGRRESRLSGAVGADGGLRIGYESASVATNAAGEVSFGATEVRTWFKPAAYDLAVVEDGFSFSTDEFTAGEEVLLTVKAANLGFGAATDATMKVYEEKGGERTELGSVVTNFPGGGVVAVQVPWVVDNAQSDLVFTVEIDAGANEEAEDAKGNNVYSWAAGTPDASFGAVSVRSASETRRLLTATVVNRGLGPLPAGAKVVFRRGGEDGEILTEDTVGEVWPGSDGVYAAGFAWDMEGVAFTSEWETVCVQLYPDGTVGTALDAADVAFVQVKTMMGGSDGASSTNVVVDAAKGTVEPTDGGYVVTAADGVTLTEDDVTFGAVAKEAYTVTIAEGGRSATVTLNVPAFGAAAELDENEAQKDESDPSGTLVTVAKDKVAARPTEDEAVLGALPAKTYEGLTYQAAWGDDIGNLTPGEKVDGTGGTIYLGVIKQTGAKGFYKVTVSEK